MADHILDMNCVNATGSTMAPENQHDSAEWLAFERAHMRSREPRIAFSILSFMAIFDFLIGILSALFLKDSMIPSAFNLVVAGASFAALMLHKGDRLSKTGLVIAACLVLAVHNIFNAWYLHHYFATHFSLAGRVQMFTVLMLFSGISMLIIPLSGWRLIFFAVFSLVVMMVGALAADRIIFAQSVVVATALAMVIVRRVMARFFGNEVQLAFERVKMTQVEETSRQKTSLELARKLQSSVMPDPLIENGPIVVQTFQKNFETVGGDWVGVRKSDKRTIVVVIDATGKGFQAALVVHAIQALWAAAIKKDFDAKSWLTQVNDALCYLGRREKHTATAGILCIEEDRVEYWSAGHTPVFWRSSAEMKTVHALANSGSIPGISEDFYVSAVEMRLEPDQAYEFIIASDGVIDRKGVYRKTHLVDFMTELKTVGIEALESIPIDDDRSVVLISRAALSADQALGA